MKKLIILAAAAMLSAVAGAAQVKWGSGTITKADGTTAGKNTVTGYLFLVDSITYSTLAANTTGQALSDAVYAAYGNTIASADANKSSTAKGAITITDPTAYSNGDTLYGVVLFVDGDNYMGNIATYTLVSDQDVSIGSMATVIGGDLGGGSTTTAWSTASVPEPTSGLLVLLGMAGLALCRRRA